MSEEGITKSPLVGYPRGLSSDGGHVEGESLGKEKEESMLLGRRISHGDGRSGTR